MGVGGHRIRPLPPSGSTLSRPNRKDRGLILLLPALRFTAVARLVLARSRRYAE